MSGSGSKTLRGASHQTVLLASLNVDVAHAPVARRLLCRGDG